MKKIVLFIIAPIITLVALSLIIYQFVDINDYKINIISLVKEKTGSEISINGDIRLRILPDVALDLGDVSMSAANGDGDVVSVSRIILHLKLMSLLKKDVEVVSLKLVNPVVKIHIFKDGNNNLSEANPAGTKKEPLLNVPGNNWNSIRDFINTQLVGKVQLSSISVEDLELRFTDERKDLDLALDNVNMETSFLPEVNPLKISGVIKVEDSTGTPFAIGGQYQLATNFYELSELAVKLGNIETHGEMGVDFRSILPDIKAAFYFEDMDLNPYENIIDSIVASTDNPTVVQDSDKKPAKSVKEPFVWSAEPVDFTVLRSFNGHFSFKSNKILYKDTNIGSVTMNSYLRNGKFTLSVKEAEIFGGNINGESIIDVTSYVPKVRHKINLEDIDFARLPSGAGVIGNLDGKVSGSIILASRGVSQKELISNVNGSISLKADDGYLKGIDLIGMAKNVTSAFVIGRDVEQKTKFKEMAGDFDVTNGVVKTDNFTFGSDTLDFNGQGGINLPELTINFSMIPKIKRAKDEADVLGGMRAPIVVSGSLLQPSFRLEIRTLVEDLIKNPNGTENLVKQLKRDFQGIKDNIKSEIKGDNEGDVVKDIKNILNGF